MELKKEEATKFFADFYGGEHHILSPLKEFGEGWCTLDHRQLATFDFDELTRLVVMAHDRGIRVTIMPSSPKVLKIALHKREKADGEARLNVHNHPSLERNVEKIRAYLPK